jgi:hypothetical protein
MLRPAVSVVVAFHDMAREAPRTLHTLSAAAFSGFADPLVATVSRHLGPKPKHPTGGPATLLGGLVADGLPWLAAATRRPMAQRPAVQRNSSST